MTAPEALPELPDFEELEQRIYAVTRTFIERREGDVIITMMQAYGDARAKAARMEALAEAERAVDDVEEPAWSGYECPNTFKDGTSAAADAIRALGGKGAA